MKEKKIATKTEKTRTSGQKQREDRQLPKQSKPYRVLTGKTHKEGAKTNTKGRNKTQTRNETKNYNHNQKNWNKRRKKFEHKRQKWKKTHLEQKYRNTI